MAYSINPTAANPVPPSNDDKNNGHNKKAWYIILIVALIGTWGYLFYDKAQNNKEEKELRAQVVTTDSLRNAVQMQYDQIARELDVSLGQNTELRGTLAEQKAEIDQLKSQIQKELSTENGDLQRAQTLINELKGRVDNLVTQIDVLKKQNAQLTESNKVLVLQNDTLHKENVAIADTLSTTRTEKARIEDEASTLHISGINITPVSVSKSGKESESTRAKRVDYLRVNFSIDENRVVSSGSKSLYIIVTDPDDNVVSSSAMGSGTFVTRQNGEKVFSKQLNVHYTQGESLPVNFNLLQNQQKNFEPGTYKIEVYNNGYRIGNGSVTLRKSLF